MDQLIKALPFLARAIPAPNFDECAIMMKGRQPMMAYLERTSNETLITQKTNYLKNLKTCSKNINVSEIYIKAKVLKILN